MKVLQTIQEMLIADPSIEHAIIDDINWDAATVVNDEDTLKWDKLSDVGMFIDSDSPPIKKSHEIPIGVRFPICGMKKLTLQYGPTVSSNQCVKTLRFSNFVPLFLK